MRTLFYVTFFLLAHLTRLCAQGISPVLWGHDVRLVSADEAVLKISARLAPGWHLYSQFIAGDAPIATRIKFVKTDAFEFVGGTDEQGKQIKFYSHAFDMPVAWYRHDVLFIQRITLNRPKVDIFATIQFVLCSEHECIPDKVNFSFSIDQTRKAP